MSAIDFVSSGIKGLDDILQGLRKGDNVVWQVDDVRDYRHFVEPFVRRARAEARKIIYIRFAQHAPVLAPAADIQLYRLDAASGFESFSKQIHDIVTKEGEGAFYVFDCLSDLLSAWATDLMIGNFFMVTCPYLFKLNTVAYFAIMRNNHAYKTIARIRETTQLLLDVYDFEGVFYLHPLKVWNRYSPTMYLPHQQQADKFIPIVNSVDATRLFSYMSGNGLEKAERNLDYWDRLFLKAEELAAGKGSPAERERMEAQLNNIMIGRETRMLSLVKGNLKLEDLLEIKARMIGTGFIGGKALGMLLARKILLNDGKFNWPEYLEPHDSFFIGSDVFYTYIVQNGWWDLWLEQKTEEGFFDKAADLKEKMLGGTFPEEIKEQFNQLLEYFGQSPIIVRSSSLLEDGFGNAFAGKYESIFCVNQGSPEERYANFERIVRQVFASMMNEDALTYRRQRGLGQQDEQMALLVQRVSGTHRKHYFFPYLAGVGVSYNTFVWHKDMDPKAGMLRLVFGLGTRAVNRVEGDYPRIIALDKPLLRPFGSEEIKKFSQHEVDLLDLAANELVTVPLPKLLADEPDLQLDLIGQRDREQPVLTFDRLLAKTEFPSLMQRLLKTLDGVYQYPVDVEFTVNYSQAGKLQVNLLQCRPLQAKGPTGHVQIPDRIDPHDVFFRSDGNFMGGSVSEPVARLIFVDPAEYSSLLYQKKFSVARLIGKLNKLRDKHPTLLLGPGRWGTRDATLGVPVSFAEINNFSVLVELADPEIGFMPELSFGSHFFLDLVEANIFYVALFPGRTGVAFDRSWLEQQQNELARLLPDEAGLEKVVRVSEVKLQLLSDVTTQTVVCLKK
jgi:hypothetical protein